MPEATLLEILRSRENRAELQKRLIAAYKTPVVCFTMNIAGPMKTTPLIQRAFDEGINLLKERLEKNIVYTSTNIAITGCEGFFCVSSDAQQIKKNCAEIEDTHPLGRLFDIDVIDINGQKLSRADVRGCLVCGKKGRECAAGRVHSVEELQAVTNKIITDYFLDKDAFYFGNLVHQSLLEEVYTTPKAGLVDRNNNGSHSDMCIELFEKSAEVLKPYFCRCFKIGVLTQDLTTEEAFETLRKEGIDAEKDMFVATNGVNTHKGAIYLFGVLCGALGRAWKAQNREYEIEEILTLCSDLTKIAVEHDFADLDLTTAGAKAYREYNLLGIRGEVASGFASIKNTGLPVFLKALKNGFSRNDGGVITLIHLISKVDDTTIYNRGGKQGADFAKESAGKLIESSYFPTIADAQLLDNEFIARNLSAGGCADLLAVTYFLSKL